MPQYTRNAMVFIRNAKKCHVNFLVFACYLDTDVTAVLREESGPVGVSTGEVTMSQIKSSSVKNG